MAIKLPEARLAEMPPLTPVRQKLHQSGIRDLTGYFQEKISASGLARIAGAGQTVGICVGSRGIGQIDRLVRMLVEQVRSCSANPLIIPSMGSHGGATAEGQQNLLAEYGITAERMGAPIVSDMAVVACGPTVHGYDVFVDRVAAGCDALIVVNRIKEHTDFSGETESGILKMLSIGLGNHTGASYIHSFGAKGLIDYIPEIAARIIETRTVFGVGIVEDGYGAPDRIDIMAGREILSGEKDLLRYAKSIKAKIPFHKLDYLVIEEMGKNISGSGVDTKVIGRIRYHGVSEPDRPAPDIIACLRLTPESHGNAAGIGLVDLISKKLFDRIDFPTMFVNGKTTKCPERYKIPMFLDNDRETVLTGLDFAQTTGSFGNRIAWIRNTADLETLYVSKPLAQEAAGMDRLDVAPSGETTPEFDEAGNCRSLFTGRYLA